MKKNEILEEIKRYNKNMLKLRMIEKSNEHEKNFDRFNAIAEQISLSREAETETITNILFEYLKSKGVIAIGNNILEDCPLSDMIFACNTL